MYINDLLLGTASVARSANPANIKNPDIFIFLPHLLRVNNKNIYAGNSTNPAKLNTKN